jgi:hypothetical protein
MAQIFHPSTNTVSKLTIFGAVFLIGGLLWLLAELNRSSYVTQANVVRPQPVPFSHKHHVSGLGIDCRYCHTAVERSAFAGIPSTSTCMNCHSQIWTNSPMLEPVRESYRTGQPLRWNRVHNLAEFVYFNHGIHVNKGVGCATCHGPVDQMPLVSQENSLLMEWCLDCHRNPGQYLRPREEVFNMAWIAPATQSELGAELIRKYNIRTEQLTDCSVCHR